MLFWTFCQRMNCLHWTIRQISVHAKYTPVELVFYVPISNSRWQLKVTIAKIQIDPIKVKLIHNHFFLFCSRNSSTFSRKNDLVVQIKGGAFHSSRKHAL